MSKLSNFNGPHETSILYGPDILPYLIHQSFQTYTPLAGTLVTLIKNHSTLPSPPLVRRPLGPEESRATPAKVT